MMIVAIAVYLVLVLLHLYACFEKKRKLRMATKPILMPLLCVIYVLMAREISLLVVFALLLGCVGDCFLMYTEKRVCFYSGLAAFGIGHILYLVRFLAEAEGVPAWFTVLFSALCVLAIAVTFCQLKPHLKRQLYAPCLGYMTIIAAMCLCAAMRFVSEVGWHRGLVLAGSLVFVCSDTILSFELFRTEMPHGNFRVMLTYIAAQTLIAVGLLPA